MDSATFRIRTLPTAPKSANWGPHASNAHSQSMREASLRASYNLKYQSNSADPRNRLDFTAHQTGLNALLLRRPASDQLQARDSPGQASAAQR